MTRVSLLGVRDLFLSTSHVVVRAYYVSKRYAGQSAFVSAMYAFFIFLRYFVDFGVGLNLRFY